MKLKNYINFFPYFKNLEKKKKNLLKLKYIFICVFSAYFFIFLKFFLTIYRLFIL
jgi:hypothetical protein